MADDIYIEENSDILSNFKPVLQTNIDAKILLGIIAKTVIGFVRSNEHMREVRSWYINNTQMYRTNIYFMESNSKCKRKKVRCLEDMTLSGKHLWFL